MKSFEIRIGSQNTIGALNSDQSLAFLSLFFSNPLANDTNLGPHFSFCLGNDVSFSFRIDSDDTT